MKLSIVIPAYNEEKRLPPMLHAYEAYFNACYGDTCEIIVVVNGSRDRTEEVARELAESRSQIRVLVEEKPIGKGGAVMMGFEAAQGDLIGFVDGDGATSPEAFDDLVKHIGEADLIIASRWMEGAVMDPRQPPARRLASRTFNGLVRLMFRVQVTDTQCGAKLAKREALRVVMPKMGLTRWAFDVDLLFQLRRAGFSIVERPTVWRDVAGSKVRVVRASLQMFVAIVRLRLLHSPLDWTVHLYNRSIGRLIHRP